MIMPISYALSFPRHEETSLTRLELDEIGTLSFEKPDLERFECLSLAFRAVEVGDSMPAVMNGANEIAVESFLNKRIGFLQISELIKKTMEAHQTYSVGRIEKVIEADKWAREKARELLESGDY